MTDQSNVTGGAVAALIATALALAGCGASLPGYYVKLDTLTEAGVSTVGGKATVPAFYVTDRAPVPGGANSSERFGHKRGEGLLYGTADVVVPRQHTIGGDAVTAAVSRATGRQAEDPVETKRVDAPVDEAAFLASLAAAVDATPRKDLLVYVHGYRYSFGDAVSAAAGLGYDLGAPMVPLAFSWASQNTLQGYPHDENNVDRAARGLADLLAGIARTQPEARVHLVAHSMGARVVTQALLRLKAQDATYAAAASRPAADATTRVPLADLVFAAADIDADEFRSRMTGDGLARLARRTTLYAAWNDVALLASERVHGRAYPRAGRAGEGVVVAPGVDTVDVSLNDASIVGHSYYGDNRAVIFDLYQLLVAGRGPDERNLLHATAPVSGQRYWLIRP